jgi:hypothetical protein
MKQMLKGDMILLFFTSSTYMKRNESVLTNLVYCSNTKHTFALSTIVNYWISVIAKKNKIEKMKGEYWHQKLCRKNRLKVANQHGHGLNA